MSQSQNNLYPNNFKNPLIDLGTSPHYDAMARRLQQIAIARAYWTRDDNRKVDNKTGLPYPAYRHELKYPMLSK